MRIDDLKKENNERLSSDYLKDIASSITKVDKKYCQWEYQDGSSQKIERVFAYELYHQLRKLTNSNPKYKELRIDGEISKEVYQEIETCGLLNLHSSKRRHFSPDMVIHYGQTNRKEESQIAIIEIKTREISNSNLIDTILKLNHYIRVLNFQYAIFISVNTEINKVSKQLRYFFDDPSGKEWHGRFNRIIIMNYNQRKLEVDTLLGILKAEDKLF